MEITGTVHEIGEKITVKEGFVKRELIVDYTPEGSEYSELLKFEAVQDKTALYDKVKVGDSVEVSFNLRGRAYEDKKTGKVSYFNSLQCWKLKKLDEADQEEAGSWSDAPVENGDDLPF